MSNAFSKDSVPAEIASEPANKGKVAWNPIFAVLAVIVIFFATQLIGGLLVSMYPSMHHWSQQQATDWLNNSVFAQFVYIIIVEGMVLGSLWLFLRHYKSGFRRIGFVRPKAEDAAYALAGFGLYFMSYIVLISVVSKLIPSLDINQQQQVGFQDAHSVAQLILTGISLVILPPLTEEILMRGFLYTSLRGYMPKIVAALVTSIIFASGHLQFGEGAPLLWVAAIDTFTLSLVLVLLREKTGRLWAPMGLHGLKNSIAFVVLFIFHAH